MLDGNFLNWLLFKPLTKAIERGVDYIMLVNIVQELSMLENIIFFNVLIC